MNSTNDADARNSEGLPGIACREAVMKERQEFRGQKSGNGVDLAPGPATASNSSAVLAVTMPADTQDVLAVIRTAALLGKNFKAPTTVDIEGENEMRIGGSAGTVSSDSLSKFLDSVKAKLCRLASLTAAPFTLEATITAASFLSVGALAVSVRTNDAIYRRRKSTR
jgi:hypothetical protein